MVERILDIYRIYGFLPSVAIFLPNENQLSEFAHKMGQYPELLGPGVDVVACHGGKVLGDPDSIRIFSIDKIKGLEFQAVFFHNIDEMVTEVKDEKLLLKHLYVGISRAAFFLALTANREFDGKLKFMRNLDIGIDGSWKG